MSPSLTLITLDSAQIVIQKQIDPLVALTFAGRLLHFSLKHLCDRRCWKSLHPAGFQIYYCLTALSAFWSHYYDSSQDK